MLGGGILLAATAKSYPVSEANSSKSYAIAAKKLLMMHSV
jgi:hypothetical protein